MTAIPRWMAESPILLRPNRVWRMYSGGKMIDALQGSASMLDTEYPEEWVGSCVQASNPGTHFRKGEGMALVSVDNVAVPLHDIIREFPEEMLGARHVATYGNNPALLVKLLDAAVRLMIHAHPDKAFAGNHLNSCFGKTEAWFVLGTRPDVEDPYVLIAFREEVSRERYRQMIDAQDVESMKSVMHRVPVRAGSVVYVRAGVPHAIGEGVFMVELQEPTDYSIILERTCDTFVFREDESFLGLPPDLTLSCIDHRVYSTDDVRRELLICPRVLRKEGESAEVQLLGYDTTECFSGRRLDVQGELNDITDDRHAILIIIDGEGSLVHRHGSIPLRRGTEVFVPSAVGQHLFRSERGMTVFKCLAARP